MDYRLAPQVRLGEILRDCADAVAYLRSHADAGRFDLDDVTVSGSSAGGYLALRLAMADHTLTSCLAIYPITDPFGDFFTNPQPRGKGAYDEAALQQYIDPKSKPVACNAKDSARQGMYFSMLDKANLAELLGATESDRIPQQLDRVICPTYVVHGDADTAVGVEQARELVAALDRTGTVHRYDELPGEDHLFDQQESESLENMYAFWRDRHEPHDGSSSEDDSLVTSASTGDDDGEEQWQQQMRELNLVLNLILLPLAGKYFGRQAAFYLYGRFVEWRYPVEVVVKNKAVFRGSGVAVAAASLFE